MRTIDRHMSAETIASVVLLMIGITVFECSSEGTSDQALGPAAVSDCDR